MQTARLKNWIVEEQFYRHLCGNVYGHPNFKDGEHVHTSELQYLDERLGIGVTRNTIYILRDIDEPEAVKRFEEMKEAA